MKIVELFRQLSHGELSNVAIGNSGAGTIPDEHQPKLVQYVNDALTTLFSRFVLSEKSLLLVQEDSVTFYHLKKKYAESSASDAEYRYIKDLPGDPFDDDVIRILGVFDLDGNARPLNDVANPNSMFTPQPDTLQIPRPIQDEPLQISYQARHPQLDVREGKILNQKIDLPFYMEMPLRLSVASKVFSHMNGQDNIVKSQEYLAAYEATCIDIEQRDLANQTFQTSHSKLEQRGFV